MPKERVLVCSCAKCGSTSLFEFLFEQSFQHPWNYTGAPYIQDVVSSRWENKFEIIDSAKAAVAMRSKVFTFALSRDPKSRIISAWKSKIACDASGYGTDVRDRARMVPELMALAGEPALTCLGFERFLDVLATVHRRGLASELNPHFRPQQFGCFRDFKPPQWRKVAAISDNSAAGLLGRFFGHPNATGFPQSHGSSTSGTVESFLNDGTQRILDEITRAEYAVLATAGPSAIQ